MPTNQEWLHKLANESPDELKAWFDAEHNDDLAAEKVVSGDAAQSNDEKVDTRAQLEDDVRKQLCDMFGNSQLYESVIEPCIDRAMAMRERDVRNEQKEELEAAHAKNRSLKLHISKMQDGRHGWHLEAEKLQRKVDELTRERDYWREQMLNCVIVACKPGGYTKGVMDYPREDEYAEPSLLVTDAIECTRDFNADVARLTAERDNLARDLNDMMQSMDKLRDRFRDASSSALDNAHEIQRIIDNFWTV